MPAKSHAATLPPPLYPTTHPSSQHFSELGAYLAMTTSAVFLSWCVPETSGTWSWGWGSRRSTSSPGSGPRSGYAACWLPPPAHRKLHDSQQLCCTSRDKLLYLLQLKSCKAISSWEFWWSITSKINMLVALQIIFTVLYRTNNSKEVDYPNNMS